MKLIELYESMESANDRIHNFISGWTYDHTSYTEGGDKDELPELYALAFKKYPHKRGALYRGMTFKTEKEFNAFKNSISSGVFASKKYMSWSPDSEIATTFAMLGDSYDTTDKFGIVLMTKQAQGVAMYKAGDKAEHEYEVVTGPQEFKVTIFKEGRINNGKEKEEAPKASSGNTQKVTKSQAKQDPEYEIIRDALLLHVKHGNEREPGLPNPNIRWSDNDEVTMSVIDFKIITEYIDELKPLYPDVELDKIVPTLKHCKRFAEEFGFTVDQSRSFSHPGQKYYTFATSNKNPLLKKYNITAWQR